MDRRNKESVENKEVLIEKIKSKPCFKSQLEIYGDTERKIAFMWSPRGGCSVTLKCFLQMMGLLEDAEKYSTWIHDYKVDLYTPNVPIISIPEMKKRGFHIIKTIVNPYSRAVSIWRVQSSHNLSFRDYLKQLVNNQIDYFSNNDKYHLRPQYIQGEEEIVTKYIRLDKYEKYDALLPDASFYTIDVTKFPSKHHAKRNESIEYFLGDIILSNIHEIMPKSYKYFYDEEIKNLVYKYYKNDIDKYGYTFDEL
jgi:hypothetical protein